MPFVLLDTLLRGYLGGQWPAVCSDFWGWEKACECQEGPSSGLSHPPRLPGLFCFLLHRSFLSFLSTSFPGGLAGESAEGKSN